MLTIVRGPPRSAGVRLCPILGQTRTRRRDMNATWLRKPLCLRRNIGEQPMLNLPLIVPIS
jgi:hypothetical protein